MTPPRQPPRASSRHPKPPRPSARFWPALYLLLATAAPCRPVSADSVWWELSRGRAVAEGAIRPSQALTHADTAADADWLGGLPCFLVYQSFGEAGLMFWRIAACGLLAIWIWRLLAPVAAFPPATRYWLAALGLFCTSSAWDPSPAILDVLGMLFVARLAERSKPPWIALPVTLLIWANLAPRVVLGWLVYVFVRLSNAATCSGSRETSVRPNSHESRDGCFRCTDYFTACRGLLLLALMALATGLTPRGPFTLLDSIYMLIPSSADWSSLANLPVIGVWLVLAARAASQRMSRQRYAASGNIDARSDRRNRLVALAVAPVIAVALAAGWFPGLPGRLGWGIDPRLDLEPLKDALNDVQLQGAVQVFDMRSAGAIAWLRPPGLKLHDAPPRAWLEGRQPADMLLADDIASRREFSYFRVDGSQGGWRRTLQSRQVKLLLLPIERTHQIAGLSDSLWRPLSLASLIVPFGQAGDPGCSRQIVSALQQEQLLSWGPWSARDLPRFGSASHTDLWGIASGSPDHTDPLLQANLLAARAQPVAALRLLFPVLRESPGGEAMQLFVQLQAEAGHRELLAAGQISRLREYSAAFHRGSATILPDWKAALSEYSRGRPAAAAQQLHAGNAEMHYARGWLYLESGELKPAANEFDQFLRQFPDHPLAAVVDDARKHF